MSDMQRPGGTVAGPPATVEIPEYVAASQCGLIKDFAEANAFDTAKVKIYTSDDAIHTYYLSENINMDVKAVRGELVAYGVDSDGNIGAIDSTNAAIYQTSGLTIQSATALTMNGTSYVIADNVVIFTYDVAAPSESSSVYGIQPIGNIAYNSTINSTACIYLSGGKVVAILIPK